MSYPVLTRSKAESLATRLVNGEATPNWDLELDWVRIDEELDLAPLESMLEEMRTAYSERPPSGPMRTPEAFEGLYAGKVHRALRDAPIEALDDPGFWRYLSLDQFWWFVAEREAPAIARGNVMTYVDGDVECVPFRMFLRGQAVRDGDDYTLTGVLPQAADFWRSHILRVKTGSAPALSRSFVRLQAEKKMVSEEVRPFARRVNRLWTNVVMNTWTEEEAASVLDELYAELYGDPEANRVTEPRT